VIKSGDRGFYLVDGGSAGKHKNPQIAQIAPNGGTGFSAKIRENLCNLRTRVFINQRNLWTL
jgi:hypothetical protein